MCWWAILTLPTARWRKSTKIYHPREVLRGEHQRHDLREPRRGLDRAQQGLLGQEPKNLPRHKERVLPNRGETLTNKVENIKSKIELLTQKVENLEELYNKNIYEMNKKLDNMIEKNVYETEKIYDTDHSKLMDLLKTQFEQFEQKFEPLLREPKIYNKLEIYDMNDQTSTTSMSSSTPLSSTSSNSTKDSNIYEHGVYEIDRLDERSKPKKSECSSVVSKNIDADI